MSKKNKKPSLKETLGIGTRRGLVLFLLAAAAALLALGVTVYFIVGPAEGYFHSDCTDTIYWAQASLDAGKVFNPDFHYAALLPFSASVWFIPLIAMFGVTMTAHVIGMVIFALLFFVSILVLCRRMKWSYSASFATSAILFLILSSSEKLREIMWNHVIYYSLGLLLYFFTLALTFYAWETYEKTGKQRPRLVWRILPIVLLGVFSLLNATNGFQMLVLTVVPVCAALFLERLLDRDVPLRSKKNLPPLLLLAAMVAGVLIGTVVLKYLLNGIEASYATAYSRYSDPSDWKNNLHKFFLHWLTLIGMDIKNGDPLFTLQSIVNLLRMGAGILLLVVPVIALCCYKKIKSRHTRILLLGHAFLLAFLFFGCVCGRLAAANWRLVPLLGSAVISTVAAVREVYTQRKTAIASVRLGVLVLAVLAMLSAYNVKLITDMPFNYGRDNELHVLSERLEKEGLTYGYATFWYSQSITLLSDSKVKCREILVEIDGIEADGYQSQLRWYTPQEGVDEYFVLLSNSEYNKISETESWQALMKKSYLRSFEIDTFKVYVFSENIFGENGIY